MNLYLSLSMKLINKALLKIGEPEERSPSWYDLQEVRGLYSVLSAFTDGSYKENEHNKLEQLEMYFDEGINSHTNDNS